MLPTVGEVPKRIHVRHIIHSGMLDAHWMVPGLKPYIYGDTPHLGSKFTKLYGWLLSLVKHCRRSVVGSGLPRQSR